MPIEADAGIVRLRHELGAPPLGQRAGTVSFRRIRLSPVCAYNLITDEL